TTEPTPSNIHASTVRVMGPREDCGPFRAGRHRVLLHGGHPPKQCEARASLRVLHFPVPHEVGSGPMRRDASGAVPACPTCARCPPAPAGTPPSPPPHAARRILRRHHRPLPPVLATALVRPLRRRLTVRPLFGTRDGALQGLASRRSSRWCSPPPR